MEKKKQQRPDFEIKIRPKEWSVEELSQVKAHAKSHHDQRTPERKLRNDMRSIQYQMEDYINDEKITGKNLVPLENFLILYLKALNLTFKKFAQAIDTTDGNLKKYLSGDRKFNTDLAFKFASFFHTTPDLWIRVNVKNELLALMKEKKQLSKYKKYDYKKVVAAA
jgi:plasmid maintenance system antidote protein VapI